MRYFYGRKIAYVNITIIAVNVIYFLIVEILGSSYSSEFMKQFGAMYAPAVIQGHEYYRLVTSMFMHFGIEHIANNMLILFILGDHLERAMGRVRYLIFYFICGIGANVVSMLAMNPMEYEYVVSAGASGAIFGVIGGLLYVVAVNKGHLEDLSTQQLIVAGLFALYFGYASGNADNVAHVAGLAIGILAAVVLYWRPKRPETHGMWE